MAIKQWQDWMQQGNQAWQQGLWQQAHDAYVLALSDVWPIWLQSSVLPLQWPRDEDSLCLPTCCLAVAVRNLACCLQAQRRSYEATQLLRQLQQWFHTALQQPHMPSELVAVLIMQQAELTQQLQEQLPAAASIRREPLCGATLTLQTGRLQS